jgi:hypothetical protein
MVNKLHQDIATYCCQKPVLTKGVGEGLFCSGCGKEVGSYVDKKIAAKKR